MHTKRLMVLFITFISLVSINVHNSYTITDALYTQKADKRPQGFSKNILTKIPAFIAAHKTEVIITAITVIVSFLVLRKFNDNNPLNNPPPGTPRGWA